MSINTSNRRSGDDDGDSKDRPMQISVACETFHVEQYLSNLDTSLATTSRIEIGVPQGERTPSDEIVNRFVLIGKKIPVVKTIVICPHRDEDDDVMDPGQLPIRALAELIDVYSDTLEELALQHGLLLTGTQEDYEYTGRCIGRLKQLQKFQIQACGVFITNRLSEVESWMTDTFFAGLQCITTLRVVEIDRMRLSSGLETFCQHQYSNDDQQQTSRSTNDISLKLSNMHLSARQVQVMCHPMSRLVKLELSHIVYLESNKVRDMANCLRNNQRLKELTISCPYLLTFAEVTPVLETLEEHTALETLELNLQCCEHFDYKGPIGDALQKMQPWMKNLRLHFHDPNAERRLESASFLLEQLGHNKSLKSFQLHLEKYRESYDEMQHLYKEKLNKCLAMGLGKNSGLTDVLLTIDGSRPIPLDRNVELALRYNRAGRSDLERHPDNRKLWVDTVIEQKEDTELVFQLLMTNPLLFVPVALRDAIKTHRNQSQQQQRKRKHILGV